MRSLRSRGLLFIHLTAKSAKEAQRTQRKNGTSKKDPHIIFNRSNNDCRLFYP
ncbi:MAG: hypothetical protein JWO92_1458 [Chitinophagaceae bacterium]|nr:hypothetical protein [Chitinophagaceae bacterium]